MDVKKFKEIKRKNQLASEPVVQTKPNVELNAQSEPQSELVVQPPKPLESIDRTKPKPLESIDWIKPKPDMQLEFLSEPVGYLESVAMIERQESIGGSGWGYSQLLKEFRE